MDRIVIDSSVLVKFFMQEEYSENAYNLQDSYISNEIEIIVPSLIEYEVMNALLYSRRLKLEDIYTAIKAITEYDFLVSHIDYNLAIKITEVTARYKITIYDAAYVALASQTNSKLYTADDKLIRAVKLPFIKHIKDFK